MLGTLVQMYPTGLVLGILSKYSIPIEKWSGVCHCLNFHSLFYS